MAEATYYKARDVVDFVAAAALVSGQVLQLSDGRAGVVTGAGAGFAAGVTAAAQVEGIFTMAKTTSMVLLDGQKLYWDGTNNKVKYTGDFFIGVAYGDAAAAATTCKVNLNVEPILIGELGKAGYTHAVVANATVVATDFKKHVLLHTTATEAQKASVLSDDSVTIANGGIWECKATIVDNGDDAALDINLGLANADDSDDGDDITESVFFHIDGNVLNILAESDDGTTEVAATDTTVDYVVGTELFLQIDARDVTDVQLYIDGVNVLPATTFVLTAATGPMKALAHMEKTSNDTPGSVRVDEMWLRPNLK